MNPTLRVPVAEASEGSSSGAAAPGGAHAARASAATTPRAAIAAPRRLRVDIIVEVIAGPSTFTRWLLRVRTRCAPGRSDEHTSELQSLMRISYAVFCLTKKQNDKHNTTHIDAP